MFLHGDLYIIQKKLYMNETLKYFIKKITKYINLYIINKLTISWFFVIHPA